MPSSVSSAACCSRRRSASRPPCTAGWRVFTRPSSDSGKPVTSATSVTGEAGVADRGGGRAGRDELDAGGDELRGELDEPVLVADGEQRAADGDDVGGAGLDGRWSTVWRWSRGCLQVDPSLRDAGDHVGEQPALDGFDAVVQRAPRCRRAARGSRRGRGSGRCPCRGRRRSRSRRSRSTPAARASRTPCAPGNSGR